MIPAPDVPFTSQNGVVLAGAGSGKTTTSIALHNHAHRHGKHVVMITFTNATMDDYIRRAGGVSEDLASTRNVFTFHKLAGLILDEGEAAPDINLSTDTIVPLAIEHIRRSGLCDTLRAADVVLVDEAQDCSSENYDLVKALAAQARATLVMIGDANQCLYRFRAASPSHLLGHGGFRHELRTNYRSSPQIVALSRMFMRHPIDVSARDTIPAGPKPTLVVRRLNAAVSRIIDEISAPRQGSLMLIGRSKHPRYEKDRLVRMGLQTIVNELTRRGVSFRRMFKETCDDEPMAGGQSMDPSRVNVLTIHGSKGLEADAVIVIDAVEEMVGGERSPDQLELMYVAFSRPRERLLIVNLEGSRCDRTLRQCVEAGLCELDGVLSDRDVAIVRSVGQSTSVTGLLSDRTVIGETELLALARMVIRECKVVGHADASALESLAALPEASDLKAFYGQLAENCLQMAYNAARSEGDDVDTNIMRRLSDYIAYRLVVPARFEAVLARMYSVFGARLGDAISLAELESIDARLDPADASFSRMVAFVDHVLSEMRARGMTRAVCTMASNTQVVRIPELNKISARYALASSNRDRLPYLFRATLFFFQLSQHAGYRWNRDYVGHIRAFHPILDRITRMARLLPDDCDFEKRVVFKQLNLVGRMDAVSPGRIVEAKFSSSLSLLHFLQPTFYGILDGGRYPKRCETWNLATGERTIVRYNDGAEDRWRILRELAKLLGRRVKVTDAIATRNGDGTVDLESESLCAKCTCRSASDEAEWFDLVGMTSRA